MVMPLLLIAAAAAAQPSGEALRLGRQVAELGVLGTALPMIQQKETAELIAAHPELSAGYKDRLRATAKRVFEQGRARLMDAEGRAYAERLSIHDMRAVLSFERSGAGARYHAAMPAIIMATMKVMGTMDFKGDVLAAYCKETGKLCGK